MSFINYNNILNSNLIGFMKNKSTMLASANVLSSRPIINKSNYNKKTVFDLLDLKKLLILLITNNYSLNLNIMVPWASLYFG